MPYTMASLLQTSDDMDTIVKIEGKSYWLRAYSNQRDCESPHFNIPSPRPFKFDRHRRE